MQQKGSWAAGDAHYEHRTGVIVAGWFHSIYRSNESKISYIWIRILTYTNAVKKNATLLLCLIPGIFLLISGCKKEEVLTPYQLLTLHVWVADSLLADGVEAGGPGQMLEKFNGDVVFRIDGTGTFGEFTGTWTLSENNQEITIVTPDIPFPILTLVGELTKTSLKITTGFPDINTPGETIDIRMTFKPKV